MCKQSAGRSGVTNRSEESMVRVDGLTGRAERDTKLAEGSSMRSSVAVFECTNYTQL